MIKILLLGAPLVLVGEQPLRVQRRLLRSLLFYLACQKTRTGRVDLATLLWPDRLEEEALRLLRETLSKLRAQFPNREVLLSEQDWVQLNPKQVYSDVGEFTDLVTQTMRLVGQMPETTPLPEALLAKVTRAVQLWHGPRLLDGARLPEIETLDSWLINFSHELDAQRQRLLERLVDHDLASGDPESAILRLKTVLAGDETNEGLQFRLISLYRRQQRYTEAINHCAYLERLFRQEGYSELPPGLESLSRKLREEAVEEPHGRAQAHWPVLSGLQAPFVGRQGVLHELQMAFHRGGAVIVFGEAGSGKSRLAQELYFALKPTPRLLLSAAHPGKAILPLQPVIQMLRRSITEEEWTAMNTAWLAPLAVLMPELLLMHPGLQSGALPVKADAVLNHGAYLTLLFESIQRLLQQLARRQRLLMIIDDAQWCDELTLTALAYLIDQRLFLENVALLLIARREELTPAMESFLRQPQRPIQQINLLPLNSEESAALVRYVMGDVYPNLTQRLQRATGGNPFYLLESLRALVSQSLDPQLVETIDYLPLTGSVQSLIRARLQQLHPDAQQVINAAAICESDFTLDMLCEVTRLPDEQVLLALETLEKLNLLQAASRDMPSGGYAFLHDQIREVVLLTLTPARKRLLHQRAARALEKTLKGQSSAISQVIAAHYEAAGDLKKALDYLIDIARVEHQVRPGDGAHAALERAESLLERMQPFTTDEDIYNLYRLWGQIAFDRADAKTMRYVYDRLLKSGFDRHDTRLIGSAYNGLAQHAMLLLDVNHGMEYQEKAFLYLEQAGVPHELAEAYNQAGMFYIYLDSYTKALEAFQKALPYLELASFPHEIQVRLNTTIQLSLLLALTGNPLTAVEYAERAYRDAERILDHASLTRALIMLAISTMYASRYQESLNYLEEARPLVEILQNQQITAHFSDVYCHVTFILGKFEESRQSAKQLLALGQALRDVFLTADAYVCLGNLHISQGEWQQAIAFYQAGCQIGPKNIHYYENLYHLAMARSLAGELQEPLQQVREARAYFMQSGLALYTRLAQLAEAHIHLTAGQTDGVEALIEEALQGCEPAGLFYIQARGLALLARYDLRCGNLDRARVNARAATELAKTIQHIPLHASLARSFETLLS